MRCCAGISISRQGGSAPAVAPRQDRSGPAALARLPPGISVTRPAPALSMEHQEQVTIEDCSDTEPTREPFELDVHTACQRSFLPQQPNLTALPAGLNLTRVHRWVPFNVVFSWISLSSIFTNFTKITHRTSPVPELVVGYGDSEDDSWEEEQEEQTAATDTSMVAHQAAAFAINSCLASMVAHR